MAKKEVTSYSPEHHNGSLDTGCCLVWCSWHHFSMGCPILVLGMQLVNSKPCQKGKNFCLVAFEKYSKKCYTTHSYFCQLKDSNKTASWKFLVYGENMVKYELGILLEEWYGNNDFLSMYSAKKYAGEIQGFGILNWLIDWLILTVIWARWAIGKARSNQP